MQVPLPTRTPTASALPAASSRYSNGCNALPNRNFSSSTVSLARHLQRSTTANRVALVDSPVQSEPREEPPKRYVLGELLGAGTAGSVFCATETQSGLQYAVKQISKAKGSRDRTRLVQKEVELSKILGDCRHAVQLLDTFEVSHVHGWNYWPKSHDRFVMDASLVGCVLCRIAPFIQHKSAINHCADFCFM
jgi:serine/threonine protein kinase